MHFKKKNLFAGLSQIHERENKIRHHPKHPLPNSEAKLELTLRNRIIYVKGFPKTNHVTLYKLLDSFFEKYASTDNIQMKKQFKTIKKFKKFSSIH